MILKSLWIQKLRWNPQNPKECMQWSRSPSQRSWRPSWNKMIPILMNMTMSILPLVSWPCVLIPTLIWQSILMRGGLWARNTERWCWKVSTISTTMIVWCNPVLGCSLKFPMVLQGLQSSRRIRPFSRIFLSTPMTSAWMPRIWTVMLSHVVGVTCSRVAHWSLLQLSTSQNIIHCVMGILYLSWNSIVMPQGVGFSLLMSHTLNDGNHSKHHRFHISTKLVLLLCQMMMNSFKVFKTGLCIDNWMTFWIGSFVNGFVIGHLSVNWRIRWALLSQQRSLKRLRNMVGTGMQLMAQKMLHCRIRLRTWHMKRLFWMKLISLVCQRMNQKDVGLGVNFPSVSGLLCVGCTGLLDMSPSRWWSIWCVLQRWARSLLMQWSCIDVKHVRKHQQRNPLTKSRFQVIIHSTILWGLMYWSWQM